jgi:hypothetical protein
MDSITRNPTGPSGLLFRFNIVYSNIAAQHFSAFALLIFLGMPAFLEQTGPAAVPNHGLSEQTRQRHYSRAAFQFFLRAIGVMLLLVVIMTAYFSVRT